MKVKFILPALTEATSPYWRPIKYSLFPPLGLATLAALCPPDWDVRIVDENVETAPLAPEADIVGICGMGVQFPRQRELLAHYRSRGYYTLAGGSYASLCNEKYGQLADTVIAGEAEYIFRQFCADYARSEARPLYHETGTVALTDSPVPRFDLLQLDRCIGSNILRCTKKSRLILQCTQNHPWMPG